MQRSSFSIKNTDYDKAEADPNLAWLAERGITLENYFGVTHPSEPNYVASHGEIHNLYSPSAISNTF